MAIGAIAAIRLKHRLRILGPDLILLCSFSLMSLLVGLLANDIGRWFDPSIIESASRLVMRISLSVTRLTDYLCTFFLPSAIISLVTAGTPFMIDGMAWAATWSPFHPPLGPDARRLETDFSSSDVRRYDGDALGCYRAEAISR